MKRPQILLLALLLTLMNSGCKDASLDADLNGGLEGLVVDFVTGAPLAGAMVTTSPPTEALVTNPEGRFFINELPEGNYSIQAARSGYKTNTVTVSVREHRITQATVFLRAEDAAPSDVAALKVDVLNWTNRSEGDSAFVRVEYRVRNTGAVALSAYEVYFRIETDTQTFIEEEAGGELGVGQADVGLFEKYLLREPARLVTVDTTWYQKKE